MSKSEKSGINLTAVFIFVLLLLGGAMLFIANPTSTTPPVRVNTVPTVDADVDVSSDHNINVDVSPATDINLDVGVNIANILSQAIKLIALVAIIIGTLLLVRNRSPKITAWGDKLD